MCLPIDAVLPALQQALHGANTVVLEASPGAGKTTRVPLALLDQPWLAGQHILMLEPRRLAARNAALRMALSLNEKVGEQVGYRVRFEQRVSRHTRIEVLTEGILTRRLQQDPELTGVGLVIFDEFHERSLHADLALALCREVQTALRPELRLLLMSATLDSDALAQQLGQAPQVRSAGRPYPVEIDYHPPEHQDWLTHLLQALRSAYPQRPGDILVFLPGRAEIRRASEALADLPGTRLIPLHGDLSLAEQQQAIHPDPQGLRRIILATPIAETSLTIEGVDTVVDSGLARMPCFQPRLGMTRLETHRISQDAADQRAGRAGRLGPGRCLRLWSAEETLAPRRRPEILDADLAPLALELARWGAEAEQLTWLDPPPPAALQQARDLLYQLQALDANGRITSSGQAMAHLPGHPRLAQMLLQARELGLEDLGCEIAALLEARDPLRGDRTAGADLALRLAFLAEESNRGHRGEVRSLHQASAQWRQALALQHGEKPTSPWGGNPDDAPGLLLALAYPDRIAQRRHQHLGRYKLSNGRGAWLPSNDPLGSREWLVAAHLDAGHRDSRIFLAAGVDPNALRQALSQRLMLREQISWDPHSRSVLARRECRLGELTLTHQTLTDPEPEALCRALVMGIQQNGLDCLPWTDTLRQWQARVESLRRWCPETPWPAVDEGSLHDTLLEWLGPHLTGLRRLEHLQKLNLGAVLQSLLPWPLPRDLDTLAPCRLPVPSGSQISLRYQLDGQPPILAARLQELFGLEETPRVAGGRVAVLVEILSPARRPVQLTADLASFWAHTYQQVRREMRGRYPKHYWPENPRKAQAIRGIRPRR